ncbi:MAG: hypothetical protein HYW47_01285 [Deltaproteobacteria bacterium]|nr:hypothetical protein [Deltaproteobacteria bacterium]
MKKFFVFLLTLLSFSLFFVHQPLALSPIQIQRALQRVVMISHPSSSIDDLSLALSRFIIHGYSNDDIACLERFLKKEITRNTSKGRAEILLEAMDDLSKVDSESIAEVVKRLGASLRKTIQESIIFPKLLEISGFSAREVAAIFEMNFGHPPTLNLIRISEISRAHSPISVVPYEVACFFQTGNMKVTLNPPALGLARESYKGIMVLDESGRIVKKLPLEDALKIHGDFASKIQKLILEMSQNKKRVQEAVQESSTITIKQLVEELLGALTFEKLKVGGFGKKVHAVKVRYPSGVTFELKLRVHPETLKIDYNEVVWSTGAASQKVERVMLWDEVRSLVDNDDVFSEIKDYLISQPSHKHF